MPAERTPMLIRWTKKFLRADAEQPVSVMRMILSQIRQNQWALLERHLTAASRFYALKKSEIVVELSDADPEAATSEVLRLDKYSSSEVVVKPISVASQPLVAQESGRPWLSRKVAVDAEGKPVAIGVLRGQRQQGGIETAGSLEIVSYLRADKALVADSLGPPVESVISAVEPIQPYSVIRIFYGTDRSATSRGTGYTNRREPSGQLHFGTCDVTIPRVHKMAKLESPRWWKFEFRWNPHKHVAVQSIAEMQKAGFLSLLRDFTSNTADHSAFVFIHGFDVGFNEAARRTAQLTYDLGFAGAPILYSWPSAASMSKYMTDETTIEWTKPHLRHFLSQIASHGGVSKLHVIAHSMGNRALVKILQDLPCLNGLPFFNQIVLSAPDIDTGEFLQLASSMLPSGMRTTLYASSNDKAMMASRALHEYPRAGESGPELVVVSGLDTVDASAVDTSFIGHSYFVDERTLLSDLFYLIRDGKAPSERHGLEPRNSLKGQFWAFKA